MSRTSRPKQFFSVVGDISLFQQTLLRVNDAKQFSAPVIITNEEYRFLVAEQAHSLGIVPAKILLEPEARNTAPAIAAAVLAADQSGENPLVFVLPCDHRVEVDQAYKDALETATLEAASGNLVTFGIKPSEPATGFGYIKVGSAKDTGAHGIDRFVEKPELSVATDMLNAGGYFWNSGMFMFPAQSFLQECRKLAPEVFSAAQQAFLKAQSDLDFCRLDSEAFGSSPSISVDHAIFEQTAKASVVPASINWSDMGSWNAVWEKGDQDKDGNVISNNVEIFDTSRSLVLSDGANVVVNGLDDIVAIACEDVTYVGRLSEAQNIGPIVERLRENPATVELTEKHRTVHRPWGGYSSVLIGERYQVKRLFVKPGKSLSLQKHHHRSEHWVVIRGTALIQIGDHEQIYGENEGVYIPMNTLHRLSNPGKIQLEVIEVQTGTYLGEDDIIRIVDEYGRT